MHQRHVVTRLAAVAALASALPVHAQQVDSAASPWTVFGAQRFWFATQSVKVLDAGLSVPGTAAAPVLQTRLAEITSSNVVPITALGVRYGKALATVSVLPSTGFDSGGLMGGSQIRRQEFDLSVGYQALPATTVSLIYKRGKASPTITQAARDLLGLSEGEGSGNAVLLGLSTSAALQGALSLYANLAYGGGRWTAVDIPGQSNRYPSRYTVADFGLAWRAGGPANVTLQLGYRTQTLTLKRVDLPVYSLDAPPQLLASPRVNAPSTTQGVVLSVGAAF
ncbi:MAG: hypothetical protein IPM99_20975 [Rubrivivax sp.]|nr:hypothetical protein [Rubrivivax sp.]